MKRCTRCFAEIHDLAVFCPHCAQLHEPDFDQLINQTLDQRYRIYRRLGQGGLSSVFAATDLHWDQVVVLKVSDPAQLVRRDLSYDIDPEDARQYWDEMTGRMRREAETLMTIDHPNIVRFYGSGSINDDLRYVVMEFLHGRTLRQEIDRRGRISLADAVQITLEIAAGLEEVHRRDIIHRDINPRNIFMQEWPDPDQFTIKLIDFGIAKFPQLPGTPPFTKHSVMSGTVAYASPEQCQSRPIDQRTDIYSLGTVIYEMLTGQQPFSGRTPTEIALKQIQSEPTPPRALNPDLPAGIEMALLRALAKNPDERQQTVEELGADVQAGSRQIVIPLDHEQPHADHGAWSPAPEAQRISFGSYGAATTAQLLNDDPKPARGRVALAVAGILVLLSLVGFLLARHLISRQQLAGAPALVTNLDQPAPTASPTPTATAIPSSDADALELAARQSQEIARAANAANAAIAASPSVKATPAVTQPAAKPAAAATPVVANNNKGAVKTDRPSSTGSGAPANAHPASPPLPPPTITASRLPQPQSQPETEQAPRRQDSPAVERPVERAAANDQRAGQDEPPTPDREREEPAGRRRRATTDDRDNSDEDRPSRTSPKLIQWSGTVNRQRVVKIEMPGVPGRIEIPRAYRERVGVVEPPSATNGWRSAVLRVFGQGNVSVLIRWWPTAGRLSD
ncbi:MAG TPA: protein kinase [Blastocatellia bacterium]|nr:protein kinase [Blastocatellia bacterium]